jgi:hypothetical protein
MIPDCYVCNHAPIICGEKSSWSHAKHSRKNYLKTTSGFLLLHLVFASRPDLDCAYVAFWVTVHDVSEQLVAAGLDKRDAYRLMVVVGTEHTMGFIAREYVSKFHPPLFGFLICITCKISSA